MGYTFDATTRTIELTTGTTVVSTNDLYSRWKDWVLLSGTNAGNLPAFETVGGESLGGGLTAGFYLFLANGWSIIPWDSDHTLTVEGNLLRSPNDLSGEPVFQQVTSNVLIVQQVSVVAIGYTTSGTVAPTASQIREAVGLAAPNLDTQIADIPTVAEFEARTLPSADYFVVSDYTAPDNASIAAILEDTGTTIPNTLTTLIPSGAIANTNTKIDALHTLSGLDVGVWVEALAPTDSANGYIETESGVNIAIVKNPDGSERMERTE